MPALVNLMVTVDPERLAGIVDQAARTAFADVERLTSQLEQVRDVANRWRLVANTHRVNANVLRQLGKLDREAQELEYAESLDRHAAAILAVVDQS